MLTHKGRFMRITNYFKIPLIKRMVRITHEKGELVVTEDHLILTQDGWKPAITLRSGGDVLYFYDVQVQNLRKGISNASGFRGGHYVTAHNPELQRRKSLKRWTLYKEMGIQQIRKMVQERELRRLASLPKLTER